MEQVPQVPPLDVKRALEERAGEIQLVDVRRPSEWREGHVEGAVHKPLDRLRGSLGGLDPARPVAVYCKSGYRSSISSSILQACRVQGSVQHHRRLRRLESVAPALR